jgi:hypothetical protein
VLYQIWDRPIYTIGGKHVITDALQLCAPSHLGDLNTAAPAITREAALLRNPELIIASAPPRAADEWLAECEIPGAQAVHADQLVSHYRRRIDRMGPRSSIATAIFVRSSTRACATVSAAVTSPGRMLPPTTVTTGSAKPFEKIVIVGGGTAGWMAGGKALSLGSSRPDQ